MGRSETNDLILTNASFCLSVNEMFQFFDKALLVVLKG
jgi:hypothetical protein